ncbi:uncharacterized protein LOC119685237 [Teleopsis dalmanni]|uniref:uncharacterized protein LOC119676102 n=1 Tax=Teleopsis dalmanni TaxID=139649 RepID=UPI0018CD6CFA|nr:uncharacterized protein LOC119676102 [Teleopsis dalmanni]XP_037955399.1 uncharacterized protein LOC119685237 [Teleopsis dalmanni]
MAENNDDAENMNSKSKPPFIPPQAINTQRVEVYLNDLKNRLQELRLKHDEVIHESVEIIQEIGDVGTTLMSKSMSTVPSKPKGSIKDLIKTFENVSLADTIKPVPAKVSIGAKVDINKILENFEKLNQSHVLKESLMLFKRCKESFEKIDSMLDDPGVELEDDNINLKGKIELFNNNGSNTKVSSSGKQPSMYGSCSSLQSVENFHSSLDILEPEPSTSTHNIEGYDGDNENSEFDVQVKKKKSKFVPPNK